MSIPRIKILGAVSWRSLEAVSSRSLASLLGSPAERSAAAATASYSEGAAGGFQVTTNGGTQNV